MKAKLVGLMLLAGACVGDAGAGKRAPCPEPTADEQASIALTNDGIAALASRQYAGAIAKLGDATRRAPGNHTAWYQLGLAYDGERQYADAARAYDEAVKRSPDDPMYRMRHGVALAKAAEPDGATANFEPAIQELEVAIRLEPRLYRAHYALGRIHRQRREPAAAAEAFSKAIQHGPREPDPYIALGELYRRWDYLDQAIQVLREGVANAVGDAGQVAFALGVALYDQGGFTAAIDAFTRALDADPHNDAARFQRGMAYVAIGQAPQAKADLEAYVKVARDELSRTFAAGTLRSLESK